MTAQVAETQARSHFPSSICRWGLSRSIIHAGATEALGGEARTTTEATGGGQHGAAI